tara:strand:- start:1922 stop:3307 length:1386 start_codon:yes stop_codon:yes gene_type:complete
MSKITVVNYFLHYFFEPVLVPLFLNSVFPNMSLISRLFTQDSIFNSSRYLLHRLSFPTELSSISPAAKYLLYLILSVVYYFIDVLTWFNYPKNYLYYLFTFITCPLLLDAFLQHQIWILEKLEETQKNILNYLTCVCLSNSLNHICVQCLNSNPRITARELDDVMAMQNLSYIWTFLKILLITTLIKYLESSKYVYGRILQILYDRGNLIEVPEYQRSMMVNSEIKNPKQTISKIISQRKWHYFYDPNVLNLIIKVYQNTQGSLLQDIIIRFRTSVLQFFTLWTLYRFIPIPFIALLFRLRDPYPKNLIIPAIDFALILAYPNKMVLIALFSEFCMYLDNGITRNLIYQAKIKAPELICLLFHQNKYNVYLALSVPVIWWLNRLNPYTMAVLPFISKYNFIYLYMLIFGFWSNYDIYHLICLVVMLYIKINLFDYRNVPGKNANLNVIKSYWADNIELKEN